MQIENDRCRTSWRVTGWNEHDVLVISIGVAEHVIDEVPTPGFSGLNRHAGRRPEANDRSTKSE